MDPQVIAVRAIIFDFDGVIVESTSVKAQALVELFSHYPEHLDAIVRYNKQQFGATRYQKFAWIYNEILKAPLSHAESEALGRRFSQLVFQKVIEAPLVAGALETLERLKVLELPVFVSSATPQEELNRIVHERRLNGYFRGVWGWPNEKRSVIRSVRIFCSLHCDELVLIGDGYADYHAAINENIPFIARSSGAEDVDWRQLGVACIPDLRPLASLGMQPITLTRYSPSLAPLSLQLGAPAVPRDNCL